MFPSKLSFLNLMTLDILVLMYQVVKTMRLVMALLMEMTVHLEVGMIKKRKSMMDWMKNIKN